MIMTSSKKTRSHHSLHTTQEHHNVTNPKKLKKCTIISGIPQKFHRFALFDPAKISNLMTPAHPILCAPWKKFWATDEASAYLDNDRLTPPNFHSGWCVPCGLWLVFLFHKIEKYIYIYVRWTFMYYLNAVFCLLFLSSLKWFFLQRPSEKFKKIKKIKKKLAIFFWFFWFFWISGMAKIQKNQKKTKK